ncbi:MAG: hypothetical protein MUP70_14405 [Candidatus Aminicenantes bacterium]|nr:hypothetical protein [Candidatus Aminicenantes bacterium]
MQITAIRSKEIWTELIREHYLEKGTSAEAAGRKLLKVQFGKDGRIKPGKTADYMRSRHGSILKLFLSKMREERILRQHGQMDLPF